MLKWPAPHRAALVRGRLGPRLPVRIGAFAPGLLLDDGGLQGCRRPERLFALARRRRDPACPTVTRVRLEFV